MTNEQQPSARPSLRVVSGEPDATELAVVVAVLSARGGGSPELRPSHWTLWNRKSRQIRPSQRPGFGAWRGSMMPR